MTANEAILFWKYWDKNSWNAHGMHEQIEISIEALEKQVEKKPILVTNMMLKSKTLCCPCCQNPFTESAIFLKTRCWNCGQKIDWSE